VNTDLYVYISRLIDDFAIIAFILLYNFDFMKIRVSSSHIMISFFLSSWSFNLINLVLIDRFLFIDRFRQLSWGSRYLRNPRIKLFSNRERSAKPYSTYSISSTMTITLNESAQRSRIYVEYFRCNSFAFCEIFSQKFLRIFHVDDDDDEDEIHTDSKKRLVLIRKGDW
jgi:hypothetical protein